MLCSRYAGGVVAVLVLVFAQAILGEGNTQKPVINATDGPQSAPVEGDLHSMIGIHKLGVPDLCGNSLFYYNDNDCGDKCLAPCKCKVFPVLLGWNVTLCLQK